jgi:hypothetical protein
MNQQAQCLQVNAPASQPQATDGTSLRVVLPVKKD